MKLPSLPSRSLLMIVSGPAGSGKTTLRERMVEYYGPKLERLVTATSREPRPGEVNGVDYHFFTKPVFERMIAEGAFYEYAIVHGKHYYGGLKSEVLTKLAAGYNLILNVDVQGTSVYKEAALSGGELHGRLVTVFIMPQSIEQLKERLSARDVGKEEEIERRLRTAVEETARWKEYDYVFTSGSRDEDFATLSAIYQAELRRVPID